MYARAYWRTAGYAPGSSRFNERVCAFNGNDINGVPNSTRADWLKLKHTNEIHKPIGMIPENDIICQNYLRVRARWSQQPNFF